jgi:hypothetical protein
LTPPFFGHIVGLPHKKAGIDLLGGGMANEAEVRNTPVSLSGWNYKQDWHQWKKDFEEEFYGKRRSWIAESMLHYAFDMWTESRVERILYILSLADSRNIPSDETRYSSPLRNKAINVLASKYFGADNGHPHERDCHRLMTISNVASAVWKFLSIKENYPDGSSHYWAAMRTYVAQSYYAAMHGYKQYKDEAELEGLRKLRPEMLMALVHTDQLQLIFVHDDYTEEMITALEHYALKARRLEVVKEEAQNSRQVLAFGWRHENLPRQAAALALVMSAIRRDRKELADKQKREAAELANRLKL